MGVSGSVHAGRVDTAADLIARRVRSRVERDSVDLGRDPAASRIIGEEVRAYAERALASDLPLVADADAAAREVAARVTGYGPLQPYLDDPEVEELWVNAPE